MERIATQSLAEVIYVDSDKCVNCHACIAACPVKYCNDGSHESVQINSNMCIACGNCIEVCTHEARKHTDDSTDFFENLKQGEKIVVGIAPSIVANFPDTYLRLNGWLKTQGVDFIFDVSFGAELTVKSYVEHLKNSKVKPLISQPCPSIVSYIQIYKPELLKYLAPVHSPMLHSAQMLNNFYPEYKDDYKIAFISPCLAKKREFDETGIGDYNVTMKSLGEYLDNNNIDLHKYPEVGYDSEEAERAVLFSTPGGLLKTVERWNKELVEGSRKIDGTGTIYEYLDNLPDIIEKGMSPVIVDCLNCELGCNAGPGTLIKSKNIDEIEHQVNARGIASKNLYNGHSNSTSEIEEVVNTKWQPGLYARKYDNLWANVDLKYPNEEQLEGIYVSMHKYSEDDLLNCVSCGYNSCKGMAVAIFNGLNKPENCHHYLQKETSISQIGLQKSERRVNNILETAHDGFIQIDKNLVIEQANIAFKTMIRCNDIIGRSLLEFLDEENRETIKTHIKLRDKNQNSSYELKIIRSDRSDLLCLLRGAPLLDENGIRIGSFAMISDITDLKAAEAELMESHRDLENKVLKRTEKLKEMMEELKVSNETIQGYNRDLQTQKEEIERQRDMVKNQSDSIQSSIDYASQIQKALMPDRSLLANYFSDYFIYLKPKDVVSGDFYWIKEKGDKVFVAAADSTGHGVPGALMCMLGISSLNDIVNNVIASSIIEPRALLFRLKQNIIDSLHQTGEVRESKEGIDMAMAMFDLSNQKMLFSGANMPIIILRNNEIIEIKGDRKPVGIHGEDNSPFTQHELDLQKGDSVYMFSDGITDQFNIVSKKKLNKKRFKELVLEYGHLPMGEQKDRFNSAFKVWAGTGNQIDDMLLIGLKL